MNAADNKVILRRGEIFQVSDQVVVVGGPGEDEFVVREPESAYRDASTRRDKVVKNEVNMGIGTLSPDGRPVEPTNYSFRREM